MGSARLLGANPNPRSVPEGHFPRGLAPQRRRLGTPEPHVGFTMPPRCHPGHYRCCRHSGRENRQGPTSPGDNRRPPRQNAWAPTHARQRPHLGLHHDSLHSQWIGPAGLLGALSNPRSAPKGPLPMRLVPQCRGLGTPRPSAGLICCTTATLAARGATCHSGQRKGQGPLRPGDLRRPPCQNAWAHTPALQLPYLGPQFRSLHSPRIGPATPGG